VKINQSTRMEGDRFSCRNCNEPWPVVSLGPPFQSDRCRQCGDKIVAHHDAYRVVQHGGTFFATRHQGRKIREAVETQLAAQPEVVLNFEDVEAITATFADELVANLVVAHPGRITCVGANEDVAATVQRALVRRMT
jgi:uncharacterized protein (DUF1330 family)